MNTCAGPWLPLLICAELLAEMIGLNTFPVQPTAGLAPVLLLKIGRI